MLSRLDSTEPKGLDEAVYRRIEVLKYLRDGGHEEDVKNIDAILEAYRTGKLKVVLGEASYWRNGVMKRDLGPSIPSSELVEVQKGWIEEDGAGRNWIEEVRFPFVLIFKQNLTLVTLLGYRSSTTCQSRGFLSN